MADEQQGAKVKPMLDGHSPLAAGATHRFYKFDIGDSQANISILVPPGAHWMSIQENAEIIAYEVAAVARVVVSAVPTAIDTSKQLAADDGSLSRPMRPVTPGEFINISHSDGATAIGAFTLVLEGGGLPASPDELTTSDETPE